MEEMKDFNFRQPYVVTAAVIEKNGKILMVKESKGPYKDKWNLPAGRWDRQEDLLDCVKREVLEETGFDFEPSYIVGFYSSVNREKNATVFKVLFKGEIGNIFKGLSDDISETNYYFPEEILNMGNEALMNINVKKAVKDYLEGKKYPLEIVEFEVV